MTPEQRRQINETIARAMGLPTLLCQSCKALIRLGAEAVSHPCASVYFNDATPDFTRDAAASRSLVEWMAADRSRFDAFAWKFGTCLRPGTYWPDRLRDVMTTPLETIAQAVWQAIGGKDE